MAKFLTRRIGWKTVLLFVMLIAYGVRFAQFNLSTPVLRFNYVEEANAAIQNIPEDQRAWPVLQEFSKLQKLEPPQDTDLWKAWPPARPSDAQWSNGVAFLASQPEVILALREGVARPHLGYLLESTPEDPNPCALTLLPNNLGPIRSAARYIKFDMSVAASRSDSESVVIDYLALMRLAEHAREHPTIISQLTSYSVAAIAFQAMRELVAAYPGLLDDQSLAQVMLATVKFSGGREKIDLSTERRQIDDFFQRLFTDDGSGGGHICYEGLRNANKIQGAPPDPEYVLRFIRPLTSLGGDSRKQVSEWFDSMYDHLEADAKVEPWNLEELGQRAFVASVPDKGFGKTIHILEPALAKFYATSVKIDTDRAGLLLALALERHRLAFGTYPNSAESLVPRFVDTLPIDPHSGVPMRFVIRDQRPLVYSSGADRDDDQGRASIYNDKVGNWFPRVYEYPIEDADYIPNALPSEIPK
jgi:hypothetical protein